jgi:hypothetical protein
MRNKNTIEFLGVWEQLHNPVFNSNEFVRIKNLENLNAHLIKEGVGHDERLLKLNEVAIYQLDLLSNTKSVEYLKSLPKKVK